MSKLNFSDLIVKAAVTLKIKLVDASDNANAYFDGIQHHSKIIFLL